MSLKEDYEKLQKDFNKLQSDFDRIMKLVVPDWAETLRDSEMSDRNSAFNIAVSGIKSFKNGKECQEGIELLKELDKNWIFNGFSCNLTYVSADKNYKGFNSINIHPFGQRTLLFKHKTLPLVLSVNSSLKLNETALSSIKGNEIHVKNGELDVRGFTG